MNILIITRLLTSGGAERTAANLATILSKKHNTIVCVFDGRNANYDTDANVIDLKMPMKKGIFSKLWWYISVARKVRRIKKDNNITHSISFLNEPDLINVLTSRSDKAIVSIRNNRSLLSKSKIVKIKDKYVLKHADGIVAISAGIKEDLINNYCVAENKIKVIYNPCDTEKIRQEMLKDNEVIKNVYHSADFKFVNVGRLSEQKGQWHLIRAFAKVVTENSNAKLYILGQGPLEGYLKELILKLNLESNVQLLGYQSNIYPYLYNSDVFVFSSLFEGLGNVLLEAMACGIPIISTDCLCGPRELMWESCDYTEVIKDKMQFTKYGILVPVSDGYHYYDEKLTLEENILADAMIYIMCENSESQLYVANVGERIKDYKPDRIAEEWIEYLKA